MQRLWQAVPFVRLVIPLIGGILLSQYIVLPLAFVDGCSVGLFLACVVLAFLKQPLWQSKPLYGFFLYALLFLLGYSHATRYVETGRSNHFSKYIQADNAYWIMGVVNSAKITDDKIKVVLHTTAITDRQNTVILPCSGQLLVTLYSPPDKLPEYGDKVAFLGNIRQINKINNPHSFDYQQFLYYKNIHYKVSPRKGSWQFIAAEHGNPLLNRIFHFRNRLLGILHQHLPTEQEFAVGAALIIGYTDKLDDKIMAAYAESGAMHALSVSGLHVGILMGIVTLLFGLVKTKNRRWLLLRTILTLIIIWIFALLSGATAAVVRSAAMFSLFIIGSLLLHRPNPYNVLAASVFLLLLFNPFWLFDIGFQLSYLAMVGLIFFTTRIYALWIIDNKIGDYLWKLTATGIAAQLVTLPIGLYYFHQIPMYFWLSGFVIVPAAELILILGISLFCISGIPFLATMLGQCLYYIIWITNACLFSIQRLPGSVWKGVVFNGWDALLFYGVLLLAMIWITTRRPKWLIASLGCLLVFASHRTVATFEQRSKRLFVVYNIYKNTLIDCIDNQSVTSILNADIPAKAETFAAQGMRWMMHHTQTPSYSPLGDTVVQTKNLYRQHELLQFYNKQFLVLYDNDFVTVPNQSIPIEVVVLTQKAQVDLAVLRQHYTFNKVVVDGSAFSERTKLFWEGFCLANNISYYDTARQGAYIFQF
ncbi:MAG: ComEC family competence protein [Saprospiraceae bacterium]|nr:ComEC family competence protein [Saprospiraceae bacterium]MBP7680123.1 ComEC family competence protein [Saprospiraceae bacterium]